MNAREYETGMMNLYLLGLQKERYSYNFISRNRFRRMDREQ